MGECALSLEVLRLEVLSLEVLSLEVLRLEVLSLEVLSLEVLSLEVLSLEVLSLEVCFQNPVNLLILKILIQTKSFLKIGVISFTFSIKKQNTQLLFSIIDMENTVHTFYSSFFSFGYRHSGNKRMYFLN
jgi:hypothetical protein